MAIEIGRNQLPGRPYFSQTSHVTRSVDHKAQFKWRRRGVLLSKGPHWKNGSAAPRECPLQALRERCPLGTGQLDASYPRGLPRVLRLEGKRIGWQPLATPYRRFLQSKPWLRVVLRMSRLPAGLQSPREKPSCVGWKTVPPPEIGLQPHGNYGGGCSSTLGACRVGR